MQQRLVADVSHELRTPLTTIQGNLDLLRHDGPMIRPSVVTPYGYRRREQHAHAPAGQ